jgi:hypothetical protein
MTRKRSSMSVRRYARRARPAIERAVAEQRRAEERAAQRRGLHSVRELLQALRPPGLRASLWDLNRNRQ